MFSIEKISNNLAFKIASLLKLDKDNKEIIAYGAFSFFQTLWAILFVIIFGLIFGVLIEALILSFTASFLRKYSGGAHASSPNICALIGAIAFCVLGIIINQTSPLLTIKLAALTGLVCFIFSYYIVSKLAPVDSPSKPIVKEKTKQRLKKSSLLVLHDLIIIVIALFGLYYKLEDKILLISAQCICVGAAWQSLTLTSFGHSLMTSIDTFFKNIATFFGGEN
ncbi:accessory gene regulator ArgB-like protein [Clostridium sp. ZS2-4]|uniref:accessory gene regulator ArgB-like protein n=1 Tax=Clostridium sp. ZS2-4 TaxID=2987703 RepID=UPI00227AB8A3|nr:accessory gene regulator B family protein [Clostridium sp. ZS2-4]MCY6354793.1 accessory gene regulator B family protein [Clostridium sp. ZS2-4]